MNDVLHSKIADALNETSNPDRWGKKNHMMSTLNKLATEVQSHGVALPSSGNTTAYKPDQQPQPTLTQLIANDMRSLVVQEAYELAESIVKTDKPDLTNDDLKTATIQLMLTLNKWSRTVA